MYKRQLLGQSTKNDGGLNVYTGMNNDGDFFIGNKKVSSATGQEEVFDAPIPSVTGEDVGDTGVSVGFDVLTPLEITISSRLKLRVVQTEASSLSLMVLSSSMIRSLLLPLVVSKRTRCSYRVIPLFLESIRLV